MEDKENVVEEKKQSGTNKYLVVIIVVLLLIIAFGFGYFLGKGNDDKTDSNKDNDKVVEETNKEDKDNTEEKEEVKVEELTKDSAVVKNLFEIFREDNYSKSGVWNRKEYNDFETKMYIAFLSLTEKDFTTKKCGDLSSAYAFDKNDFIFHCGLDFNEKAGKYYAEKNWEKFGKELANNTIKTISADKLRDTYESIFGKDSTYKDENLSLNFDTLLYYDANNKIYARFNCQCGGSIGEMTPQVIDNITQNKTNLIIHTSFNYSDGTVTKIDYTFEYEKETGNYIFVSRSVV